VVVVQRLGGLGFEQEVIGQKGFHGVQGRPLPKGPGVKVRPGAQNVESATR
jgi:hypothetical protein